MEGHIVITGATGVIGAELARRLIARGEKVVLFARSTGGAAEKVPGAAACVRWDSDMTSGKWVADVDGAKAIIHLAGKPLLESRWTEEHKKECYDSRINGTKHIVSAMRRGAETGGIYIRIGYRVLRFIRAVQRYFRARRVRSGGQGLSCENMY